MIVHFSSRFERDYAKVPTPIQKTFDKKLALLLKNIRHSSLHAKKYDEARDVWQARVNRNYRFYFRIEGDTYKIISITPHP